MLTLTSNRRTVLILAALLTATVAVYAPVAWHEYISIDDHAYVSDNKVVQAGLTWYGVVWAFNGVHVANYHPVTWLSHMLDCELFGPGPRAGHLVNLGLHTVNSLLLFLVLRRMTGREWCSAFVAAVFALHPQHVESVAWISERKDVLSGLFWILTLAAWTWHIESPRWWKYALALFIFALGLLSKPMVVTLPCVLLLLDFWPLRRTRIFDAEGNGGYQRSLGFLVVEKIPFLLLAFAACVATVLAQSDGGAVITMEQIPLGWRVGNVIVAYLSYARKFLWPSDLAVFYPLLRPEPLRTVLGALAALILITALVIFKARSKPYLPVGWLWFVGTLVPVIGLVQVGNQSMADRYMYLPMIGLALMLAWLAADLLLERYRHIATVAAVVALLACGVITWIDARAWRNSETLFTRAIERTEPNVFAYHNLAAAKLLRGQTREAVELFAQCADFQPTNPHIRRAYGAALRFDKRYEDALQQLNRSIELDPKQGRTWSELGSLHLERENWTEAAEALSQAARLRPDDYETRVNLAVAHRLSGNLQGAMEQLQVALKINPRQARPWCGYGTLLLELGQPARAIEPLQRAAALDPGLAEAHYRLGVAFMRTGRGADALTPLMTALSLDPRSPAIMTQLAWVLATHPDQKLRSGDDAAYFAGAAVELTQSTAPDVLDALAAAQAELGQFDRAVGTATRALSLARETHHEALVAKIEQRLERYRAHQAMRDATLVGADGGAAIP